MIYSLPKKGVFKISSRKNNEDTPFILAEQWYYGDRKEKLAITKQVKQMQENNEWSERDKARYDIKKKDFQMSRGRSQIKSNNKYPPKEKRDPKSQNSREMKEFEQYLLNLCHECLDLNSTSDLMKGLYKENEHVDDFIVDELSSIFWTKATMALGKENIVDNLNDSKLTEEQKKKNRTSWTQIYSWKLGLLAFKRNENRIKEVLQTVEFADVSHIENMLVYFLKQYAKPTFLSLAKEAKRKKMEEENERKRKEYEETHKEYDISITEEDKKRMAKNLENLEDDRFERLKKLREIL